MKKVFLDTNIVLSVGKPPYGPEFTRVINLVEAEQIKILTTDLTATEVARNYAKSDFEEIKSICKPKFRKLVKDSVNIEISTTSEAELWDVLKKKYGRLVKKRFKKMGAEWLRVSDVEMNKVFSEYFNERGFFTDGSGKKYQFPDAFVFERLKIEASKNEPIIIVSKDKDFERPVSNQKHISLVKSLPELFNELELKLEDPEIEHFLAQQSEWLRMLVDNELSNWWLVGDIEDSEIIGTEVIDVKIIDTIAFESAEDGGPILVVGRLLAQTFVDFTFPEMSTFDIVNCQNEKKLAIDVSLSISVDDKGDPIGIVDLEFRNNNFVHIELNPYEDFWYEF